MPSKIWVLAYSNTVLPFNLNLIDQAHDNLAEPRRVRSPESG